MKLAPSDSARAAAAPDPVSAVIKVCALDTPYLEVIVPHMLRQARYPFAETVLVVDPRRAFTGKYARRISSAELSAFPAVLDRLLASGVVNRTVTAEASPDETRALLERYFVGDVDPGWSHDVTGAPVYSALLGLEAAQHDRVLLMDADILFYSGGASWVAAGVELLRRDPSVWFVMTHAGAPAGEPGTRESLDLRNRATARWHEGLEAWCFRHVSSRYFLTDRRRLRGAVPVVRGPRGLEPLEKCFSHALERAGAWRINLALPGSWDLHVHDHDPPFPAWAPQLVQLVERGIVPVHQRAEYELQLRRAAHRIPWRALLERSFPGFDPCAGASGAGAS